jgi:hypothetical protein
MPSQPLALVHPIDELELDPNDMDPVKWDTWKPPALFLVERDAVSDYMPSMDVVSVDGKGRIETAGDNEVIATFWLSTPVNWIWRLFFEVYRGEWNVTFEGNALTMRCGAATVRDAYDHVVYHAIPKASRDYANERSRLVWLVYLKVEERARCERVKRDIESELEKYREEHRRWVVYAREKNCSVTAVVENFQRVYREALANKFAYVWSLTLDPETLNSYRARFESEMQAS